MRRFPLFLVPLVVMIMIPTLAGGATKSIAVTPMSLIARLSGTDQTLGMVVKGKAIYLFGTTVGEVNGSDGFLQALDGAGVVQWSVPLNGSQDEIATAATVDSAGNIWVVGSSASGSTAVTPSPTPTATPMDTQTVTATPTPSLLNPDGVVLDPVAPIRADLTSLVLWKVSRTGSLLATYTNEMSHPVLVRSVSVNADRVNIVGTISTSSGSAGFLSRIDVGGVFSKTLLIGKNDTEINALVGKGDGSLTLFGSSAETLGGTKLKGVRDGIIVPILPSGKIGAIIRSSNTKSTRTWHNATNSLFLGGYAIIGSSKEAVVTKFASNFVPTWTTRFSASSTAMTADGPTSHFLLFSSTTTIAGIRAWKPVKPTALTLVFDTKGALTRAYGAREITNPMSIGYSRDLGVVVLGRGNVGVSIFHTLTR